jgi:hypothetical protein
MDHDVRAALSLAQAKARSSGAQDLDVAHLRWALDQLRADSSGGPSSLEESAGATGESSSPTMLPFSAKLERAFSGCREQMVTLADLVDLTRAP